LQVVGSSLIYKGRNLILIAKARNWSDCEQETNICYSEKDSKAINRTELS